MNIESYQLRSGETIKIPIPTCYKDCFTLAKSDRYRITGKKSSNFGLILNLINLKQSSLLFWFRLSQYKGIFYPFCKILYKFISRKRNVQIPTCVKAGYGLYLGHSICMVVNEDTIVGNNVNLSQFLNIGTNNETPALIGDMVYIGPFVCVVEDVHIGSYSTIGAGAVVVKDVQSEATVVGVPAHEINRKNPEKFITNIYPVWCEAFCNLVMKKRIFIAMHYMEIGGAEISLIGLLQAIDYSKYDVDLFIYSHQGELMRFIPKEVNLLPELAEYSQIEKSLKNNISKRFWKIVFGKLKAKCKHSLYRYKHSSKKEDYSYQQFMAKELISYMPSLDKFGEYDLAISFMHPHNYVLQKVLAKKNVYVKINLDINSFYFF